MPRKCSVYGCKANYDTTKEKCVYSFPEDENMQKRWIDSLPNQITNVTEYMGVCQNHWPNDTPMIKKRRYACPAEPPSIFDNINSSCCKQMKTGKTRDIEKRNVATSSRNVIPDEMDIYTKLDNLPTYADLINNIDGRDFMKYYGLCKLVKDNQIVLLKMNDNLSVHFTLSIDNSMQVSLTKAGIVVPPKRDILGFSWKLSKWSAIESLIEYLLKYNVSLEDRVHALGSQLKNLADDHSSEHLVFLSDQLIFFNIDPRGRRFDSKMLLKALKLYLFGRSTYKKFRELLTLPSPQLIESHFGCEDILSEQYFNQLLDVGINSLKDKYVVCLFDEVYVQPSLRYRGGHIIGKSIDDPSKAARTVLAIMIKPLIGGESFICRLLPVYSLSKDFLMKHLMIVVRSLGQRNCDVVSLISDNHPTNRQAFRNLSQHRQSIPDKHLLKVSEQSTHLGAHPDFYDEQFFMLFDTVHLFKSIRNNWLTEGSQTLEMILPGSDQSVCARWTDLEEVYEIEKENVVRSTKLTYPALHPNSIERQKVSLMLQVFDYSTVAALDRLGKDGTARFVELFTRLWNMLNVKNPQLHVAMNDPDRKPYSSPDDPRFDFILSVAEKLVAMKAGRGKSRCKGLTYETRRALCDTFSGFVACTKYLLSKPEIHYFLSAGLQTDDLEGEFGVFRQMSGGMYFISVEQILYSSKFRNLKLFAKLESVSERHHSESNCCTSEFSENHLFFLDDAIESAEDSIDENESVTLFYIAGYLCRKERIPGISLEEKDIDYSHEFHSLLRKGDLVYPPEWLFNFTKYCYYVFNNVNIHCANKFTRLISYYLDCIPFDYEQILNVKSLCRRICNCFFAGFIKKANEQYSKVATLSLTERKTTKLVRSSYSANSFD